jgi:nucleotide-binding universal stress UspA family protein
MADPLIVGVDATTESLDALAAATRLARQSGAPVIVVHVEHLPSLAAVGEAATGAGDAAMAQAIEQAAETARAQASARLSGTGLDWSFELRSGDPATELVRCAVAHHAVAIVVAGKAHGVVGGLLLGSVAQKLVRLSPVSVVVARDGQVHRLPTPSTADPAKGPSGPLTPREGAVA